MRLTRGRGWIAVLGTMLVGIVALNVIEPQPHRRLGSVAQQIAEMETEISGLHAQIAEAVGEQGEAEAARLGMATPTRRDRLPERDDGSAARLAHLLGTDGFLLAPSQPSSYPAPGTSYAPVSTSTSTPQTTTVAPAATPVAPAPTTSGTESSSGTEWQRNLIRLLREHHRRRRSLRPGDATDRSAPRAALLHLLLLFSFVFVRAFWLQGVQGGESPRRGARQQVTDRDLPGERGRVLDRNGKVLAVSEDAADVVATPYQVEGPRTDGAEAA